MFLFLFFCFTNMLVIIVPTKTARTLTILRALKSLGKKVEITVQTCFKKIHARASNFAVIILVDEGFHSHYNRSRLSLKMDHEWHLFYSLRGRLDAVTLPNPSNGTLTVAHIRDAIFFRINKVLKDYCVIEVNLVDPITELQLFIGAPLEELLFELDKQHDACGGAPRPRIGSAQRPFKIIMDDQLVKVCERHVEEEGDKRKIKNEYVV